MIAPIIVLLLGQSYCHVLADTLTEDPRYEVVRGCQHGSIKSWPLAGGFYDDALTQLEGRAPDVVVIDQGEYDLRWLSTRNKKKARQRAHVYRWGLEALIARIDTELAAPVVLVNTGKWVNRRHKKWKGLRAVRRAQATIAAKRRVCGFPDRWQAGPRLKSANGHQDPELVRAVVEPWVRECAGERERREGEG